MPKSRQVHPPYDAPPTRGSGSAATNNGQLAFTAASNNSTDAVKARAGSGTATVTVNVPLTVKASGKFFVSAWMSATSATTSDPIVWTLSDGTTTYTAASLTDATATAGVANANVSFSEVSFPPNGTAAYAVGTTVTWTLTANSPAAHALTTTALKNDINAIELPG